MHKDLIAALQIDGIPSIEKNQPIDQQATELTEFLKSEESIGGFTPIQTKQGLVF